MNGDGMRSLTTSLGGQLAFGADYNPEQWPQDVWAEDVRLMREAGVNLVSVGIFSWALLEPEPGTFEFGWLDTVVDLLHDNEIAVDLATATASPPPWFLLAHPEAGLVDDRGVRRAFGARQAYCPSSPAYLDAAGTLASRLAERYAEHPGVVMWHLNNELGCHNWQCYCATSAEAFRSWLRARHGTLSALNDAWGTSFWSQRYTAWEQLAPPSVVAYNGFANPGQQLDWRRFCSDALLGILRTEAAAVRAAARQPVTTNFMGFFKPADYRSWVGEQDIVSNDHYLVAEDPQRAQELAMTSDLLRSLAGGRPWLVMEHSTSAVNWQPRNLAKAPGEMRRNTLQHLARGADGALFFQWRASRAGAEKYHSGMVPHAGTETRLWREVVGLGRDLRSLAEITGSQCPPPAVGILFDWSSWWAAELDAHPSVDVRPLEVARRWHDLCWAQSVSVGFVGPDDDLTAYDVVVAPVQYLMGDALAERLEDYVRAGGRLVASYFTGIVDADDHVRLGGYPGALRSLLGISIEEFYPLAAGETVALSDYGTGRIWSELGRVTDAEVRASYAAGPCAGSPAVTRRSVGDGSAWYVGTELDDPGLAGLAAQVFTEAGVRPEVEGLPRGVEVVRREGRGAAYTFVINHTAASVTVPVAGTDLLTGTAATTTVVDAGGVAVVRA